MASIINASTSGAGGVITTADASGVLNIQTAGTNAITVDASQNVGIGTSSPSTKLQVNGGVTMATANWFSYGTDNTFYSDSSYGLVIKAPATSNFIAFRSSNDTERMRIDSSGYITNQANGNTAGLVQGYKYYRLDSGLAGANATGAQSIFGVGVTLAGSTVYEFEMVCPLLKSAGTTSHTISLGFGGTATINNCAYTLINAWSSSGISTTSNGANAMTILTASSTVVTAAFTGAGEGVNFIIKGTVSINAGGTFIPQYTLSAAPGGAYTTQVGSYIKISPISASGANTNIGSWA